MDTKQKQEPIHVNSFIKGMNSDLSYDTIDSQLYVFGKNIRITNNALLSELIDANSTESAITPINEGCANEITNHYGTTIQSILAVASIENIGAIIVKNNDNKWTVYRADIADDRIKYTKLFTSSTTTQKDRFSVVIHREFKNLTKLYIADGVHPLMTIILDCVDLDTNKSAEEYYNDLEQINDIYDKEDKLSSNRIFPNEKLHITKKISGELKTQQVLYTYRFYQKHHICSSLAPYTNKLLVIDGNRNKEVGNAKNTKTSIGFQLSIPLTDAIKKIFNCVQVFRISYYEDGKLPEIHLIHDSRFDDKSTLIILNDGGVNTLKQYSIDEFSALRGQTLIPNCIEYNNGYMFEGNVKDETLITLSDVDATVTHEFITYDVLIHDNINTNKAPSTNITETVLSDVRAYLNSKHVEMDAWNTYNDISVSSLIRSLRRGETYRYGIVFYDKYGARTDAQFIDDIKVPTALENPPYSVIGNNLYAHPLGIKFHVSISTNLKNIVGYEIVRCEKSPAYSTTIHQCVISRPVRSLYAIYNKNDYNNVIPKEAKHIENGKTILWTPYRPLGFLTTNNVLVNPGYGGTSDGVVYAHMCDITADHGLYLIHSPEILMQEETMASIMSYADIKLHPITYIYGLTFEEQNPDLHDVELYTKHGNALGYTEPLEYFSTYHPNIEGGVFKGTKLERPCLLFNQSCKPDLDYIYRYYNYEHSVGEEIPILAISSVKHPEWNESYSDIQMDGSEMIAGIKQYKAFLTGMSDVDYCNWCACSMYDMRLCQKEGLAGVEDDVSTNKDHYGFFYRNNSGIVASFYKDWMYDVASRVRIFTGVTDAKSKDTVTQMNYTIWRRGWTGPGPVCMLIKTDDVADDSVITRDSYDKLATWICNVTHKPVQFSGSTESEKQYDIYYGFGNYQTITESCEVFDGEIYITPCEIITLHKTYNFTSTLDSLFSSQIVYYVPLESTINTFFDYGMNFRNTHCDNTQLLPCSIEGIASQERPCHAYNMIYSDNNTSGSIFAAQIKEVPLLDLPQRIAYSQLKTNGEDIDSWHDFKAIDYIDADTRYGIISNLITHKDTLYFWLTSAFGKLSVNERSLVKDENSNSIQLGQAGVLQRTDYIDTKHGMREQDYSAIASEIGVYWIDIQNKAIMQYRENGCINLSEVCNVQNILNNSIDCNIKPNIDYDAQNNELLCQCILNKNQLVFNLKFHIATAIYTREYDKLISFNNVLYGIKTNSNLAIKYNYLTKLDNRNKYLSPTEIQFIVNGMPSITKVFDNQLLVVLKKNYNTPFNKEYSFTTDIYDKTTITIDKLDVTDREGNLSYCIPRYNKSNYGNRLRGKWMKVDIVDHNPSYDFAISHVITKFRQSFS